MSESVVTQLANALDTPAQGAAWTIVSVPAPRADLEEVFARFGERGSTSVFWDPRGGASVIADGEAHRIDVSGPRRFRDLRIRASEMWRQVAWKTCAPASDGDPPQPRMLGGLAFEDDPRGGRWEGFGGGSFVLPKWCYFRRGGAAWLNVAASASEIGSRSRRARLLDDLRARIDVLRAIEGSGRRRCAAGRESSPRDPSAHDPDRPRPATTEARAPMEAEWTDLVDRIARAVRGGRLEKVVVARRTTLEWARTVALEEALRRLPGRRLHSTRFLFRRGARTFLGATPERLIAKREDLFLTEALAGSLATTALPDRSRSQVTVLAEVPSKVREEHDVVVRFLQTELAPFAREVYSRSRPSIRGLGHVAHLVTPFRGRLREGRHILDLAEALHPTPAVGGAPADAACAWIREHEGAARGWYAGPVGWFDARGDGEMVVALRSALLEGRRRGVLFAGAGIVLGSDAIEEYREVDLKERTMRTALGISHAT